MELPTPTARYLGAADRDALARFRCSRGTWYEDDVERFVSRRLLDYHEARRSHTDHAVVGLELPWYGLVAVGAHEEDLTRDADLLLTSTYLELAAVSLALQGAVLPEVGALDPDGKPVSLGRWLAEVLLSDIATRARDPVVRAVVARDNDRSLALCERIGLCHEREEDDSLRAAMGRARPQPAPAGACPRRPRGTVPGEEMATRAESSKQDRIELPEPDAARDWLRKMMLIRRFEERAGQMYAKAKVGGFLHLAIGEEATIVGAVEALRTDDYLISTYRSHGHALARGTSPDNVMAELFGKVDGTSGGRGGSMHIFDVERRFMGGYGIVGGNLPLGAGLALASDYKGTDEVTLCVFGDGASNQGTFGETMNLAALWKLPIVFMVTNNQFGMGTAIERHSAVTDLKVKGESFGVPGVDCDGMDVMDTYRVTCEAIRRAREERQPILVEAETYRFRGHSMADPEEYRTKEQVEEWRKKDPIETFAKRLEEEGILDDGERERMDEEVVAEIDRAVQFADDSEFPPPESLYDHIYVLGGQVKGWYSVDERAAGVHRGEDEKDMAGELGARAEGHEATARDLDEKDTKTDESTPVSTSDDDESEGGTDRGDLPKESADSDGANKSPGG